mgnify:FL=1
MFFFYKQIQDLYRGQNYNKYLEKAKIGMYLPLNQDKKACTIFREKNLVDLLYHNKEKTTSFLREIQAIFML